MRFPPILKALLVANVVVFALQSLFPMLFGKQLEEWFALYYVDSPFFHIWQPLTYMFMHGGISHLFFNMFALWMFGRVLEYQWGSRRFLTYYIICGLGAALAHELCQATGLTRAYVESYSGLQHVMSYIPTIGASGAVYGILMAFGMLFPEERIFIFPLPVPIKAKWFVMGYAAIEILEGLQSSDGVAHFAHLGGMVAGFFLILYYRKKHSGYRISFGENFWKNGQKSRMHTTYGSATNVNVSYGEPNAQDHEYNARRRERTMEIDRILDKVRQGGYHCLTEEEKRTLFDASKG